MKYYQYIIVFLIINFGALALGSWLMNDGPRTAWYLDLNKAPWTPPGWLFGVAWSVIMICFSVYMASLVTLKNNLDVYLLYGIQLLLNISWNYVFFNQHHILFGFIIILALTFTITVLLIRFFNILQHKSWLIAPYFTWLCIATSLNGYILINN